MKVHLRAAAAFVLTAAWAVWGQPSAPMPPVPAVSVDTPTTRGASQPGSQPGSQPATSSAESELPNGATAMIGPATAGPGPDGAGGGEVGKINSVAITSDGRVVVTGGEDGAVRMWVVATGKETRSLPFPGGAPGGPVNKVLFSADGRLVAAGNTDGVFVWDSSTGKSVMAVKTPSPKLLCFAAGGKEIATRSDKVAAATKQVMYWTVAGGALAHAEKAEDLAVPNNPMPPDWIRHEEEPVEDPFGEFYGSLWWAEGKNAQQGLLFTLAEKAGRRMVNQYTIVLKPPKEMRPVGAFSMPDGRFLAIGGVDTSVAMLDLPAMLKPRTVKGHKSRVSALAFSSDGKSLVSADEGGVAYVWSMAKIAALPSAKVNLDGAWAQLAADSMITIRFIWQMADGGDSAVAFMEKRLCPVSNLDKAAYEKLIADLDNNTYAVRKKALEQLTEAAPALWPRLKETMDQTSSAQVRNAMESIIAKVDRPTDAQELRSVQVLERIGTADAVKLLAMLAAKDETSAMSKAAKAALEKMPPRPAASQPASGPVSGPAATQAR